MSDLEFDDSVIAGAVADYREETMPYIRPAGAGAAFATVSHRRKVRAAGIAGIVAVAMIGTGTAYAALSREENGPPDVGVTVSASPSAPPSTAAPSTSAGPSATGTAAGRHGPDDLSNATLNLPAWHVGLCPHGATKFSGGSSGEYTRIEKVLSADVDRDGAPDDVALISCRPGEGPQRQVVAFHRGPDGKFATIGLVTQPYSGDVKNVEDMAVAGSEITVKVGDTATNSTDGSRWLGVFQWRTYGWTGSKFTQTKGSTSFSTDKSAIHLTAAPSRLVFAKPTGDTRRGTLTITVHNTGDRSVNQVGLVVPSADVHLSSDSCTQRDIARLCQLGTLAAGATKKVTFDASISAAEADYAIAHGGLDLSQLAAQLRVDDQAHSDITGFTVAFD
jgi:hypothetical protein